MPSSGKERGDRTRQWGIVNPPVIPDWEAAHTFLEVARCGSFRAAALKLNQSINVLRRRLDSFEQDLGVPLLIRHISGVQLTAEGQKIYAAAIAMENASFDLLSARNLSDKQLQGEVTLAVTEGLSSGWMAPQLVDFLHPNPELILNLRSSQSPPDLLRLEADISVQLERPKELDLKVVKLGRLHLMLFASRSYLDRFGYPANIADLNQHRFVVMADDARQWEQKYKKAFPDFSPDRLVTLRNNVSSAHFSAIANGAGIGALPTYVQAIGAGLVPLTVEINADHDIWLAYRADAKRVPRIAHTIGWIIQMFDPRRFPWFRDEFIHPERFPDLYKGRKQTNHFGEILLRR